MAVSIYKQLQAILYGAPGDEVLSAIDEAATIINDARNSKIDISVELEKIRKGAYGRDVRQSIHDALLKLSQADSGGGGGEGCKFILGDIWPYTSGIIISPPFILGDMDMVFAQETNDDTKTSSTLTISTDADRLLLCCVMHRANVSIDGDGWTKIVDSPEGDPDNNHQVMTIWAKKVSQGSYTATVTQESSVRMSMKLIAIRGADSLDVSFNGYISESPYTPTIAKAGKKRLYVISSVWASSGNSTTAWYVSDYNGAVLTDILEERFCVWYDSDPDNRNLPTFVHESTDVHDTGQTLTILEVN